MTENNTETGFAGNGDGSSKPAETHKSAAWEWVKSLLWALVIALLIREFVIQAFTIPTGSMESTMLVGDHLFVNKLSYGFKLPFTTKKAAEWGKLKNKQIIVFLPPHEVERVYVKRCIGVPGDTIKIINKELFVNGEKQEEKYKKHLDNNIYPEEVTVRDNINSFFVPKKDDVLEISGNKVVFNGITVTDNNAAKIYVLAAAREKKLAAAKSDGYYINEKKIEDLDISELIKMLSEKSGGKTIFGQDYYFMMGDNRDNSNDSRFWGFVPKERLIGRPILVWMPLDRFGLPPN